MPEAVTAANISGKSVITSKRNVTILSLPVKLPRNADPAIGHILHHLGDEGEQPLAHLRPFSVAHHQHRVGTGFEEGRHCTQALALLIHHYQADQVRSEE